MPVVVPSCLTACRTVKGCSGLDTSTCGGGTAHPYATVGWLGGVFGRAKHKEEATRPP